MAHIGRIKMPLKVEKRIGINENRAPYKQAHTQCVHVYKNIPVIDI
jgi:hypothetical protein